MSVRITCINKAGGFHSYPHQAITSLSWVEDGTGRTGRSPRLEMYQWLKDEGGVAYVQDRQGNKAFLYPRENAYGTKFVQTRADRIWTDNLLSLPECM
jgi:Protein of unknown function (DUF3892)